MQGTIEIKVGSRQDGTPMMFLKATDKAGRQVLTHIETALETARFLAVPCGKADIGTVCGSMRVKDDVPSVLAIPLALGCIDFKLNERIT
jgi:hypothetical protein